MFVNFLQNSLCSYSAWHFWRLYVHVYINFVHMSNGVLKKEVRKNQKSSSQRGVFKVSVAIWSWKALAFLNHWMLSLLRYDYGLI